MEEEKINLIWELIDKGVLEIKTFSTSLAKMMKIEMPDKYVAVTDKYQNALYSYLESIVASNAKIRANHNIKILTKRLDIQSFDESSKKELLKSKLNELSNEIDDITLTTYGDKELWKSMILDYYSYSDYKEFYETKKLKKVFENEEIKDWIEISSLYEEIRFIQNTLKPELRLSSTLIKVIDKNEGIQGRQNIERQLDELNKIHREKYGIDIPFGAFLFDTYKKQANAIEDKAKRLNFYKVYLHYWTELSLKDSEIITEKEIIGRLIPLIKNEIDLLQTFSNSETGFKPKGFQSRLTNAQIESLFNLLRGKYIDEMSKPEHFRAIFKNEYLPLDYIPIKRTKIFTVVLLAHFVSELFQQENQSDYWHIASHCFDKATNLKQSLRNAFEYNPERKPRGYKEIDAVLKSIYSPLQ